MKNSIRISEKHGVNPSLMLCFYCGEPSGVALVGRLPGDAEAPRQGVFDKVPCTKCQGFMQQGIICIGVDAEKTTDNTNPYRDGNWCVLTEDGIRRALKPGQMQDHVLRSRVCFIDGDTWEAMGLPKARSKGASHKGSAHEDR